MKEEAEAGWLVEKKRNPLFSGVLNYFIGQYLKIKWNHTIIIDF